MIDLTPQIFVQNLGWLFFGVMLGIFLGIHFAMAYAKIGAKRALDRVMRTDVAPLKAEYQRALAVLEQTRIEYRKAIAAWEQHQ